MPEVVCDMTREDFMAAFAPLALGWHRDLPGPHDYTPKDAKVARLLSKLKRSGPPPNSIDWRAYCGSVPDQQHLPTSVAHACVGLLRYFERRAHGRMIEPSPLFVHQVARRLRGGQGEGGELRAALAAIARFGVPPESLWPYRAAQLDREPDAFVYAAARRFHPLNYVRLDPAGKRGKTVLQTVRSFLAAGFVAAFGFPVCTSVTADGEIAYPTTFDTVCGGQAVIAVGYDDEHRFRSDKGALLIGSSWGDQWGDHGYGWLPYSYLRKHLAVDFWTLAAPQWLDSGEFERPE